MKTVVGVFNDEEAVETAIPRIADQGISNEAIGVMWRDHTVEEPEEVEVVSYRDHHEDPGAEAGKGAAGGAIGGAATGAGTILLASAGIALLPGIGALLAAGTAAATAAGAAAGAVGGGVTGGLIGLLIGAGDDEATKVTEEKTVYRNALERDGYLVSVDTPDDKAADVERILADAGATDVTTVDGVQAHA
jgi:hypothetical protein